MLEKIVTDLESSKRLKELGVDLETPFAWSRDEDYFCLLADLRYKTDEDCCIGITEPDLIHREIKAYTLEQILEVLPKLPTIIDYCCRLDIDFDNQTIGYFGMLDGVELYTKRKDNESLATTAARLLIKLLEDKVITIEEVNK